MSFLSLINEFFSEIHFSEFFSAVGFIFLKLRPLFSPAFPAKIVLQTFQNPAKPAHFMPFTQNLYIQLPASTESRAKQASAVSDKFLISTKPLLKNPARIRQTGFPGKSNLPKNSAFLNRNSKGRQSFQKSTSQKPYILNIAL